jgi:DNA-binding IclR family transcriptional regulator
MKQGLARGAPGVAGAQSIRRAVDVIRAVAQFQRSDASLSRIARATGLNQSTAFRILRSLTEERMLWYDEVERSYHLGILAFELGLATAGESQVQNVYRPVIEEISRRTRLTSYLMARSDNEAVCLLCVEGASVIRAKPIQVGQRVPLGIGAGSVAILSTLDDEEIPAVLEAQKRNYELYPGGRREVGRIIERVEKARENGFSISVGSVAKGVCGIGVPLVPRTGLMQLAISISAVTDSINVVEGAKLANIIKSTIQELGPHKAQRSGAAMQAR